MKHDCWTCLHLICDRIEETSCNKGNNLFPIFIENKCQDWNE